MTRRPCTFRQADVTRALKGAVAAGVEVKSIEIDQSGKIVMITSRAAEPAKQDESDWDEVLTDGPH